MKHKPTLGSSRDDINGIKTNGDEQAGATKEVRKSESVGGTLAPNVELVTAQQGHPKRKIASLIYKKSVKAIDRILNKAEIGSPKICHIEGAGHVEQPIEPMPDLAELERLFAQLIDECGLTAFNKDHMLALPAHTKWQIYCARKGAEAAPVGAEAVSAEHYIDLLSVAAALDDERIGTDIASLNMALRTDSTSFVQRFIAKGGLAALVNALEQLDDDCSNSRLHGSLVGCLHALMSNETARRRLVAHDSAISTVTRSLSADNPRTKISVLLLLGDVCLLAGGYERVLQALTDYQQFAGEGARFQRLVYELARGQQANCNELKTAVMCCLNALLSRAPNQQSRMSLRYELLALGIPSLILKARANEDDKLKAQLDIFEQSRADDERTHARRFDFEHVDLNSAPAMLAALQKKLEHTVTQPYLLSLLRHMLLLPCNGNATQYWQLLDELLKFVILRISGMPDVDATSLACNLSESASEALHDGHFVKACVEQVEQRLDVTAQERAVLIAQLKGLCARLATKSMELEAAEQRAKDAESKAEELQRRQLQALTNGNGGSPDLPIPLATSAARKEPQPPSGAAVSATKKPDSKRGAPGAPPAPPPPPVIQLPKFSPAPQPSTPLKSFNWSKLPHSKLADTVWSELKAARHYQQLGLESIDQLFASQPVSTMTTGGEASTTVRAVGSSKITVLDVQRAQNCAIFLRNFNMSWSQLTDILYSMDCADELPADTIEQLLKFVATDEERALLQQDNANINTVHRDAPDLFLYEMSKLPNYEQRLQSLYYKKRFPSIVEELIEHIDDLANATREVEESANLRTLLELVLALGNYMNRGSRGQAYGFRLASLNRLSDTKSSTQKDLTLLHYIAELSECRFEGLRQLAEDLPHVPKAAKVSIRSLEAQIEEQYASLAAISHAIECHQSLDMCPQHDKFTVVMQKFHNQASVQLAGLEKSFGNMKTRFVAVAKQFGEDGDKLQTDEFFGTLADFLSSFAEARKHNLARKQREAEQRKRAGHDAELKTRTLQRRQQQDQLLAGEVKADDKIMNDESGTIGVMVDAENQTVKQVGR